MGAFTAVIKCPASLVSPSSHMYAFGAGKQLFAEALATGTLEGFFKLVEHFRTQDEPAFCGLASLAMALNALAGPPAGFAAM